MTTQTVQKPWGHEYPVHENKNVGVWFLRMKPNEQTSMHLHCRKKAALILLDGHATVDLLSSSHELRRPLDKIVLRQRMFHQTTAGVAGCSLIEVEAPPDKGDLLRMEDRYGREGEGYEEETPEPTAMALDVPIMLGGCYLTLEAFSGVSELKHRELRELLILLSGSLDTDAGEAVTAPGDILGHDTILRLTDTYTKCTAGELISVRTVE